MTTGPITVINTFIIKPGFQKPFIELMKATVSKAPKGCLSIQLHASLDGRKVINRSQWASVEDFEKRFEGGDAKEAFAKIKDMVESFEQTPYVVVADVEIPQDE